MKKLSQLNEGLFTALKINSQVTKAQGAIAKYFKEHSDEYKTIEDIKRDLRKVSEKAYKEYVTHEEAISFSKWYPDFEKSYLYHLENYGQE